MLMFKCPNWSSLTKASTKTKDTQNIAELKHSSGICQYLQAEVVALRTLWVFAEVWKGSVEKGEQDCITQVSGPSNPRSKQAVAVWAEERKCNGSSKLH